MSDKLLLDYDPLTGVAEHLDFSHEGGKTLMRVVQTQEVTPHVEHAKSFASDSDFSRQMLKSDRALYARIPYYVEREMRAKHGVFWEDKNDKDHKRFFRVLNREYPVFKMVQWNHE